MCLPLDHLEENRLAKGEHLGFEWEIVHNGRGNRCGYVKVLPGHPWFGKSYSCSHDWHYDGVPHECNDFDANVHGGITFADYGKECATHGKADEWWVGFDCAHAGDAQDFDLPWTRYGADEQHAKDREREFNREMIGFGDTVKDTEYVKAECISLCEQASQADTVRA